MKHIFKSTMLLLCTALFMAACSDDRDDNPTLLSPSTFQLNRPAFSTSLLDLATSTGLPFTWSQPAYGFTAAASYQLEFSLTQTWNTTTTEAAADETGATKADYFILDDIFTTCNGTAAASKMASGLQQLGLWAENAVPTSQKVYARVSSTLNGSTIYSNVVEFNVSPYYVELNEALPEIWYLTGGCIGDGSWANDAAKVGTGMMPMFVKAGESYDKLTGKGVITFTGYFPANAEFKIIEKLGNWDYGICGDGAGGTSYREGGSDPGNITISDAGYYQIDVNTKEHTCTITALSITPTVNSQMLISGDFNSWGTDTQMTAANTASGQNHLWTYELSSPSSDTTAKFLTDSSWSTNWGDTAFPYGTGTQNGPNIPVSAGVYTVVLNDITGDYVFISKD